MRSPIPPGGAAVLVGRLGRSGFVFRAWVYLTRPLREPGKGNVGDLIIQMGILSILCYAYKKGHV